MVDVVDIRGSVSLEIAQSLCGYACERATELGLAIVVTVVDRSTNLVAANRMDGASVLAIDGSAGKAVASALFGRSSGELQPNAERPVMQALSNRHAGRFVLHRGAVPLFFRGDLVGACGVGGGPSEQDEECAAAAVTQLSADWSIVPT